MSHDMTDPSLTVNVNDQIERFGTTPAGPRETRAIMFMRAFLALSALAAEQATVLRGGAPIRPLASFPDPIEYFSESPYLPFNSPQGYVDALKADNERLRAAIAAHKAQFADEALQGELDLWAAGEQEMKRDVEPKPLD